MDDDLRPISNQPSEPHDGRRRRERGRIDRNRRFSVGHAVEGADLACRMQVPATASCRRAPIACLGTARDGSRHEIHGNCLA